jgi:hypothetical protein
MPRRQSPNDSTIAALAAAREHRLRTQSAEYCRALNALRKGEDPSLVDARFSRKKGWAIAIQRRAEEGRL